MWAHVLTPPATLPKLLMSPLSFFPFLINYILRRTGIQGGQSCHASGGPERAVTDLLQQCCDDPLGGGLE